MPLPNLRSSARARLRRTWSGRDRVPPPTTAGTTNIWYSSTSPAAMAWAASRAPPTLRSRPPASFSLRSWTGSKSRSIRALAVSGVSRVMESDPHPVPSRPRNGG